MAKTNGKPKPVKEVRMGRIKAAIWANDTETGIRHNVTFTRIYKTEDGWESTASFGRDDLPLLAKVADRAHSWIYSEGAKPADGRTGTEETDTAADETEMGEIRLCRKPRETLRPT